MLRTVPHLTSDDLKGPEMWGPWWLSNRHVFSLFLHPPASVLPRYQFGSDLKPLPVMQEVLAALDAAFEPRKRHTSNLMQAHDWAVADWMYEPNARIGDQRPYRLLRRSPRKVVQAALAEKATPTRF